MRILGIDPGLGITGYGLIEFRNRNLRVIEAGVIRSDAQHSLEKRLSEIYRKIVSLTRDTGPQVAVLEQLYSHYKHPRTSILMGHARGAICVAIHEAKVNIPYHPGSSLQYQSSDACYLMS